MTGGAAGRSHRRWVPFWALQAYELVAALLFVWVSAHLVHGTLLTLTGVVLALCCLTADGPLGIVRWCGRRLHVAVVLVVAAASLGALALASLRPDAEGLVLLLIFQAGLGYTALLTATTPQAARADRTAGHDGAADGAATGSAALDRAARSLGGAAAAGRKAAEARRPAVEDSARRTARGAGRLAGRLTGRSPSAGRPVPPAEP
jgi:hypothetical protein